MPTPFDGLKHVMLNHTYRIKSKVDRSLITLKGDMPYQYGIPIPGVKKQTGFIEWVSEDGSCRYETPVFYSQSMKFGFSYMTKDNIYHYILHGREVSFKEYYLANGFQV